MLSHTLDLNTQSACLVLCMHVVCGCGCVCLEYMFVCLFSATLSKECVFVQHVCPHLFRVLNSFNADNNHSLRFLANKHPTTPSGRAHHRPLRSNEKHTAPCSRHHAFRHCHWHPTTNTVPDTPEAHPNTHSQCSMTRNIYVRIHDPQHRRRLVLVGRRKRVLHDLLHGPTTSQKRTTSNSFVPSARSIKCSSLKRESSKSERHRPCDDDDSHHNPHYKTIIYNATVKMCAKSYRNCKSFAFARVLAKHFRYFFLRRMLD